MLLAPTSAVARLCGAGSSAGARVGVGELASVSSSWYFEATVGVTVEATVEVAVGATVEVTVENYR